MSNFPEAMPHGEFEELFPDLYQVSGTMRGEFFGDMWQFGRNMFVVKEGDDLTVFNSIRLDDEGMAKLDSLGKVKNVVKLGSMHGYDDAYYLDRYDGATYWALPNMPLTEGLSADKHLSADELPVSNASVFVFEETKLPEAIVRLDREGGIMLACDALQNWEEADAYTDDGTKEKMTNMGFFAPCNCGPAWVHTNEPKPGDFARLKEVSYEHALCGHGSPVRGDAANKYAATFKKMFEV
jgi:hypothetical protein